MTPPGRAGSPAALGVRGVGGIVLLVALRLALDLSRLVTTPWKYWNWEEAHSASVGWYAWNADLWDRVLDLQYKSFCGGCTVLGLAAAPLLGLGGDHFVLWKGIALAWTAATLVASFVAVDRTVGRAAAWGALVLLAVPPLGFSDVSLMLWGNHTESALLVAVGLALAARDRSVGLGIWLGLSVWFARTTLYGVGVILLWQLWRHRADRAHLARLAAGLLVGGLPLLVPAGRGDSGFYDMSPLANLFPKGPGLAWLRLQTLVFPAEMAPRLFRTLDHQEPAAAVWLAAAAGAVALGLRGPARLPAVLALVFGFLYLASGFAIARTGAQGGVINLRYHAPWFYTLLLTGGATAGAGLAAGGTRRWLGAAVGLGLLGAALAGWAQFLPKARWTEGIAAIPEVSHPRFTWIAVWRFDEARLAAAHSVDPTTESWLRRMEGYRAAGKVHGGERTWADAFGQLAGSPDALEAFGQALTDPDSGWQGLAAINGSLRARGEAARALGRGIGWNLGFGTIATRERRDPASIPAARRTVAATVDQLRAGLGPEEPCWTCVAAGAVALSACKQSDPGLMGACLRGAVLGLPDADEVLRGAAVWCRKPGHPREECDALDAGPAFAAGLTDPMAGVDRSFKLIEVGQQTVNPPGG